MTFIYMCVYTFYYIYIYIYPTCFPPHSTLVPPTFDPPPPSSSDVFPPLLHTRTMYTTNIHLIILTLTRHALAPAAAAAALLGK